MSIAEAGKVIGYRTTAACLTARQRGKFPLRVREIGNKLVVTIYDLIEYVKSGESQADQSIQIRKKPRKYSSNTGRPSKRESLDAAAAGITVPQLRAQRTQLGAI